MPKCDFNKVVSVICMAGLGFELLFIFLKLLVVNFTVVSDSSLQGFYPFDIKSYLRY